MKAQDLVNEFMVSVAKGDAEVYNEFSLQHEFGIFLRAKLPGSKIQFERNVSFFFPRARGFVKKEIDLCVFNEDGRGTRELLAAWEFKFPRNGQVPMQMFKFCEDIRFAEQLKAAGFKQAFFLALADDASFYEGKCEGIYGHFRCGRLLSGIVRQPVGNGDAEVRLSGSYGIVWQPFAESSKYICLEV